MKENQSVDLEVVRPGVVVNALPIDPQHIDLYAPFDSVINRSHHWDPKYIGWESVRDMAGTGFEGYFVGSNLTQSQIEQNIKELGRTELRRMNYSQRMKIMSLLFEGPEKFNLGAAIYAHRILGSMLMGLRADMITNNQALHFRNETETLCALQFIEYTPEYDQQYTLPRRNSLPVELNGYTQTSKTDEYRFMEQLGHFAGNPIVRQTLALAQPSDIGQAIRSF